jgi:Domain of unknown function (DUF305)
VPYLRFAAMIATSTVVMFSLMYLNTYALEHVFFSETRVYMAIVMGACMAIIMMGYMFAMYPNRIVNVGILAAGLLVFAGALWLVRSQATIGQTSYMRAMIPHHSIAIMTSERAQITDPRVRKLADEIIEAQNREIAEMRYLIADLAGDGNANGPETPDGEAAPMVASLSEALSRTVIAELDPEPVTGAEADRVLPDAPACRFSRVASADPILVARAPIGADASAEGVMKLNGALVPLEAEAAGGFEALLAGPTMVAEGVRISVRRVSDGEDDISDGDRRWQADLLFELDQGLTVGYRGFYLCDV